jgi:hypothetical protein
MNLTACFVLFVPFCGQPPIDSFKNALNLNVHADPLRTGSSMAVLTAIDIVSFYADIFHARAAVAPPLRWPKQADNRRTSRDRDVRWPGVTTHIDTRAARQ